MNHAAKAKVVEYSVDERQRSRKAVDHGSCGNVWAAA
jgi:hypothetical protein